MSTTVEYKVKSGDTLTAIAKKYNTTVSALKKANGLTSDLIKVNQILKLPKTTTAVVSAPNKGTDLKFPFIILKSKNTLFGEDSKHSSGKKLPEHFYSKNGEIYKLSKEKLGEELASLMEFGSINSRGIFEAKFENVAVDMAKKFLTNKSYSLQSTYSVPDVAFLWEIRKSKAFENYRKDVENQIRLSLQSNGGKINNGQLIFKENFKRFHFQDGLLRGVLNLYENYWQTGFIITVDQVSYVEVELNDVEYKNGIPSKLRTTFILYDTFGLDMEDMVKFGKTANIEPRMLYDKSYKQDVLSQIKKTNAERGLKQTAISQLLGYYFICWWVLQYYHNCVPLLVKLRIENVEINI